MALSIGQQHKVVVVDNNFNGNIVEDSSSPATTTYANLSDPFHSFQDYNIKDYEDCDQQKNHPNNLNHRQTPEQPEQKVVSQVILNKDSAFSDMCQKDVQSLLPENGEVSPVGHQIKGANDQVIQPHCQLPKPEAPPGLSMSPSKHVVSGDVPFRTKSFSENLVVDVPSSIGRFFKERSNSFSTSIVKRLTSFKDQARPDESKAMDGVTEFNISGLNVVVRIKNDYLEQELKGRVSFFSRSNCRDCTAVRTFLRQKGLRFVEINVDVYPQREKELIEKTGTCQVPQIFFNDKLFGDLVALNSLRNSGYLDQRLKELLGNKCSGDAPSPPVYGFDDPDQSESPDEILGSVKLLRQRLPIQDRLMKMKLVKNCFAGTSMVDVLVHHLGCDRKQAVEIGKKIARKHFIHHVFGENDFEDGNHFYRFLEHEPYIPKIFNFGGSTDDHEPKPANVVGQRIYKIMSAILESYATGDRLHVDYAAISESEEFRRYVNSTQDLQRINLTQLTADEKLAFFLNLYNAMTIHAVIRFRGRQRVIDRKTFNSEFQYIVGGHSYSLDTIKNGILRNNRRLPYSLVKPLGSGDKRLEIGVPKMNPLVHFGLCNGTRSSPVVQFFTAQGIDAGLRSAAREFFQRGGVEVDLEKRAVSLTRIFKWFSVDFGQEKEILKWVINFLDANKAGLLTHLLGDGGPVSIVYQNFDWSINY
ncbi:hypothetical protein K2173_009082 [Erythroxylum novogranatense]|uniref:DEP domain-containing protein n=1 Tax=Erythroxylum novogranatense TaxID=1862640 RepID=A0AAV8TVA7_9ROSI|nr:hypothetical protein K2173_009082 [Erythroxylum novogranatense]